MGNDASKPSPLMLDDAELALLCVAAEETLRPTWEVRELLGKLYAALPLGREMDARQSKVFAAALFGRASRPHVLPAVDEAEKRKERRARVAGVEALVLFAVSRYEELASGGHVALYASFADTPDPVSPTLLLRLERERWSSITVGLRYDIAFAGGDLKSFAAHEEIGATSPERCTAHGGSSPCCERVGEYDGFGSDGPLAFTCPKGCSCHD